MGDFLSTPKTSKESEDGENSQLRFGVSSMQGWRLHQEDAHNSILDFDKNASLFAVFDGHLGRDVSEYSSRFFPDFLKRSEDYAKGNFELALKRAFMGFDETLKNPEVFSVLKGTVQDKDNLSEVNGDQVIDGPKVNNSGSVDLTLKSSAGNEWNQKTNRVQSNTHTIVPGFDSGCTALVSLLVDRKLFVASAGDSRCVLCREGQAISLSFDHKPTDDEELYRIISAGGRVANGRVWNGNLGGLNLSRAFGDHNLKQEERLPPNRQMVIAEPNVIVQTLQPDKDEFMVLACDGIWDSMTGQDVVDFVRKRIQDDRKLSTICEELFDQHLPKKCDAFQTGCDNMTCVIVQFLNKSNDKVN